MSNEQSNISERLLEMDPVVSATHEQLNERVRALYVRDMTRMDWIRAILMGCSGLLGATVCGMLAITEPAGIPMLTRIILGGLTLIGLFWVVFSVRIIRNRNVDSATHDAVAAKMGFVFAFATAALMGILSLAGKGATPSAGLAVLLLATLLLACVVLVSHLLRQSELRVQQKLLEMEYRLCAFTQSHDRQ